MKTPVSYGLQTAFFVRGTKHIYLFFYFSLILISIVLSPALQAQGPTAVEFRATVYPPVGTAAELSKYGDVPVSLSSGTPNIGIPLGAAQGRQLNVPITLSYYAAGIKVGQVASWVGTGWNLQAGGVITRVIKGLPDETATDGLYRKLTANPPVPVPFKQSLDPSVQADYDLINGTYHSDGVDVQPDLFYFSFMGRSGKLGYDEDGTFYTFPEFDFKFVVNPLSAGSTKWEIIDVSGTRFIFGSDNGTDGIEHVDYFINNGANPPFTNSSIPTAWYLTQIISADGKDIIDLQYTTSTVGYTRPFGYIDEVLTTTDCGNPSIISDTEVTGTVTSSGKGVLSKIISDLGTVEFITTSTREDVATGSELQRIEFKDTGNNKIRSVEFTYDTQMSRKRFFLTSLTEKDAAANSLPSYDFTYYLPNPTDDNNLSKSYHRDYWGFFNGFNSVNREASNTHGKVWSLKSIKYPSGGKTEFDYEAHSYREGIFNLLAGGIRVKNIKTFATPSATEPVDEKIYQYTDFQNTNESSGQVKSKPWLSENISYKHFNGGAGPSNYCAVDVEIRQNMGFFGQSTSGSTDYTHVTVFKGNDDTNQDGNISSTERGSLGKTEYEFYHESTDPGIENGVLKKRKDYIRTGSGASDYQIATEVVYDYELQAGSTKSIMGLEVERLEFARLNGETTEFDWNNYDEFLTKNQYLTKVTNKIYDEGDISRFVETATSYFYEGSDHHMLTREEYTDQNGDIYKTIYKYPSDYTSATGGLLALQQKHILDARVETINLKSGRVVSASKTDFSIVNPAETDINKKRVYPSVSYAAELASPVLLATFEAGNYYSTAVTFNLYTDHGQLKESTGFEGIKSSNIFNTDDILLIARVTNAPANKTFYTSFEEGTTSGVTAKTGTKYRSTSYTKSSLPSGDYKVSFWARKSGGGNGTISGSGATKTISSSEWQYYEWNLTNVTSVTLNPSGAYLDELRIHPPTALMTTFNYDNQYRKIDETGANNITVYFTYDGFGRLIQQKDYKGNLLTELEYQLGY